MKEKINQELGKLQKELSKLESAVAQISKAEKISSEVVNAVKDLQKKYAENLTNLQKETTQFLNDSLKANEKKIKEFIESSKKENDKVLSIQQKYTSEVINSQKQQITDSGKLIAGLQDNVKQSDKTHTESLQKQTQDNKEAINTLINSNKEQTEDDKKIINLLVESHKEQVNEVSTLLNNYLELAETTAQLSTNINSVDFPQRFDIISANIGEMNSQIRTVQENIKAIEEDDTLAVLQKRVSRSNKRANFNMFLAFVIVMLLSVLAYELVFVKYFPDLNIFNK